MIPYPEIYDFSDTEAWIKKFLRKEILTQEWDLSLWEISTDIFEIPVFTSELCDKLISNNKESNSERFLHWNNPCDKVEVSFQLSSIMDLLIQKFFTDAFYHVWKVDTNSVKKMTWDHNYFIFNKNKDLRVRHDECFITMFIRLDNSSEGGDLYFPKYDFTLTPQQGHIYFFPGRLTHRYGMTLVKENKTNNLFTYIDFQ